MNLASLIDHTILKPNAFQTDIERICIEAKSNDFFAVCINSCWINFAKKFLEGSNVKICTVVGFPLGAMICKSKVEEAKIAIDQGADEIDMVLNIGYLKSGLESELFDEIANIKKSIGKGILKVILETCYLEKKEIVRACELSVEAGADFVKTSTGFAALGANFEDVQLMLDTVKGHAKVKASGGIRDYKTAVQYAKMGVSRLGTSNSVEIIKQADKYLS